MLLSERVADYELTPAELRALPRQLCEGIDVRYDEETGFGQWDGKRLTKRYEWELGEPTGDAYRLIQREYVSPWVFFASQWYLFVLAFALALIAHVVYLQSVGVPGLEAMVNRYPSLDTADLVGVSLAVSLTVASIGLVQVLKLLPVVTELTRAPNPLLADRHRSIGYAEFDVRWIARYEAAFVAALLAVSYATGDWRVPAVGFVGYSVVLILRGALALSGRTETLVGLHRRISSWRLFPSLGKRSLQVTAIVVTPVATLALLSYFGVGDRGGLLDLLFAGGVLWLAAVLFRLLDEKYLPMEYHGFTDDPKRDAPLFGKLLILLGRLGVNAVLVVSLFVLWYTGPSLFLSSLLATAFAMAIPVGSYYQYAVYKRQIAELLDGSEPYEPAEGAFEYPIRRYDGSGLFATSVIADSDAAIVVSEGVLEQLTPKEVAAIIAHEEGHLKAGDTALTHRLTRIGSLLMIGRNVLFSLVDFYERELAADAYAARTLDPTWLSSALETWRANADARTASIDAMRSRSAIGQPNGLVAIGPEIGDVESRLQMEVAEKFGLFYSGFALTEAHPTIAERQAAIETYCSDNRA